MPAEIAEAPAAETAPVTPFAAAFEKAAAESNLEVKPDAAPVEKPPVEKPAEPKKEAAPKEGPPRELFKKPAADGKPAEPEAPASAIDAIAEPTFKDGKGKAGWDAIKKEAKAQEAAARANDVRAKELESKLAEYEPLKTKLSEQEKKLAEYDSIVTRARLEDHPEFRKEFIDGRATVIKRAQAIIEESGGDPKDIETALNLKGKPRVEALREAASDLDSFQSARLGRAIDELNDLDERAGAKREQAQKAYAELQEQERQREIEGRTNKFKNRLVEFDDTTRRLRGQLEVLNKSEGNEGWNAQADSIVKEARAAVEANPDLNVESEILSRALPIYRDLFMQADAKVIEHEKKIADLEAELKAIHGKSPSLASRGGAPKTETTRPFMAAFSKEVGE